MEAVEALYQAVDAGGAASGGSRGAQGAVRQLCKGLRGPKARTDEARNLPLTVTMPDPNPLPIPVQAWWCSMPALRRGPRHWP